MREDGVNIRAKLFQGTSIGEVRKEMDDWFALEENQYMSILDTSVGMCMGPFPGGGKSMAMWTTAMITYCTLTPLQTGGKEEND